MISFSAAKEFRHFLGVCYKVLLLIEKKKANVKQVIRLQKLSNAHQRTGIFVLVDIVLDRAKKLRLANRRAMY